jgi:WD40 repeat protein
MVLNDRERQDVRASVIEYLHLCGLGPDIATAVESSPFSGQEGTLEKRWGTIRRLSAKNVELETQIRSLQQEISLGRGVSVGVAAIGSHSSGSEALRPLVPTEFPLATLRGHRDTITSVSFHPTESICFSSSEDGSVRVWDTSAMILITTVRPHTDSVNQVAVEPRSGDFFATCSNDKTIKLFQSRSGDALHGTDVNRYECVRTLLGHEEPVSCICWCGDDEKNLLSGSRDGEIRLWDIDKCVTRNIIVTAGWVRCITVPVAPPSECGRVKQQQIFGYCGNDDVVTVRGFRGEVLAA